MAFPSGFKLSPISLFNPPSRLLAIVTAGLQKGKNICYKTVIEKTPPDNYYLPQ